MLLRRGGKDIGDKDLRAACSKVPGRILRVGKRRLEELVNGTRVYGCTLGRQVQMEFQGSPELSFDHAQPQLSQRSWR